MAWALYLSNSSASSVTDAQLAELDDFELATRAGPAARARLLSSRIGHIVHALVCAAGSINSRSQMLRSVHLLQDVLRDTDHSLLRLAVRGLITCHLAETSASPRSLESSPLSPVQDPAVGPAFLRPLVNIAVNRVSDVEVSATAADSLAILLGCPSLDPGADDHIPPDICDEADQQTRRLIAMLITEIVLTASPRALSSLSKLLRRDAARVAFCEKDGVSTLASTLQTDPRKGHTAIGEIVSRAELGADPVYASYHAVFAVWMLTFATNPTVVELVLNNVSSSRLVVVLSRLLNHASGQRLKIARVTLASLRNMAAGDTALHKRVRRDLISAEVPSVLQRLMRMTSGAGSLIGKDDDAMMDAHGLHDLLAEERLSMSTVDAYVAEVRAGALHWSAIHKDRNFWVNNAQALIEDHRDVIRMLAETVTREKTSDEEKVVACHDLALIMTESAGGRRAALSQTGLKKSLMTFMTSDRNVELQRGALKCVQLMLLPSR